jgi:Vacuolar sorting-associated protein 13, N-terminal
LQVPVARAPQLWWRHAGNAVLREIAERKRPDQAARVKVSLQQRNMYTALYQSHIRYLTRPRVFQWLTYFLQQKRRLRKLEEQFDIGQIALYRWWALARLVRPQPKVGKSMAKHYQNFEGTPFFSLDRGVSFCFFQKQNKRIFIISRKE